MKAFLRSSLLLAIAICTVAPATAAEWRNTPGLEVGAGSDTNVRLTPTDSRYVASSTLTAMTDVTGHGAAFDLHFRPQLRSLRYDDPRELDRDDAFAAVDVALRSARAAWTLAADYASESTLTSELERTGFVEVDVEREQAALRTSWQRQVGEVNTLRVDAQAFDVDYGEALLSPLVDYGYRALQTSVVRAVSERSTLDVSVRASRVTSPALGTETDSRSVDFTWSHRFSSALRGSFGAGAFEIESVDGLARSSGALNLGLDGRWPRWTLRSSIARELQPDGRGTLVHEDALELAGARRISERLTIGATLRGARIGGYGDPLTELEHEYAQAGVTLQWRAAERWSLYAAVLERSRVVPAAALRANGRQGVVSISYRGS